MFESAELGHKIKKEDFATEEPVLREKLLDVQYELLEKPEFSVIILVGGVDGAGKGETANLLLEWMDPRHIHAHAIDAPTKDEKAQPRLYRFWQRLPPRGKIGVFLGSWYTDPIIDRGYKRSSPADFDKAMAEIVSFERMLSNERVLVIKFWLHLAKRTQKKRLQALEADSRTAWRVTPLDWERYAMYDRFRKLSERALRTTSTSVAPWYVIESTDDEYRALSVGHILHDAIRKRIDDPVHNTQTHAPPLPQPIDKLDILGALDLNLSLEKEQYTKELDALQAKLNKLSRDPRFKRRSVVMVFEGSDAAGKGGAIRRITGALDARQYRVIPIAAPTDEEKARPYLWRFWRNLPRQGKLTIFDRSWYGRVLVEGIEKFCDEADWMLAYGEINDFEEGLYQSGTIVLKFWLQISSEMQLQRFEDRQKTSFKRYKLGPEDWRNREKWSEYQTAASEMIDRTGTEYAPWTIVEANDKRHARVKVLRTLCDRLEAEL